MNRETFDDIKLLLEGATRFPVKTGWKIDNNRWLRFDYAIPELKLAIEIEGSFFMNGQNSRGSGYIRDMEKYNLAQMHGWTVLRYTPDQRDRMCDEIRSYITGDRVS